MGYVKARSSQVKRPCFSWKRVIHAVGICYLIVVTALYFMEEYRNADLRWDIENYEQKIDALQDKLSDLQSERMVLSECVSETASSERSKVVNGGKWHVSVDKSPIDDKETVYITLRSEDGGGVLWLKLAEGGKSLNFKYNGWFDRNTTCRMRFDANSPSRADVASKNGHYLFWSESCIEGFLDNLRSAEKFALEADCEIHIFDVRGFAQATQQVANWL